MNWNIIIPIIIFITDVILAWFCYQLGCRTVKPIQDNNQKFWEERELLKKDINTLNGIHESLVNKITDYSNEINSMQDQLFSVKKQKELIEESNKQAQEFITQSEQLAKEKAKAIYQNELSEWNKRLEVVKKYHQQYLDKLDKDVDEVKNELQSLKDIKAATIAAAQKEKEIQENKDDYCLILPIEYSNDIKILQGVVKQIAKPRSILMAIWQAYYAPLAKKKFPQILGKTDVCGIYKITNQETGECYIGQAVDVRRRWMDHCKAGLGIDTPQGNQLYAAMLEYGLDSFSFELLLECESDQLNEKEKYFIELYNSDAIGYNMNKGVK